MTAIVLLATHPPKLPDYGVVTLQVECSLFCWTELLTHRSFGRNASSARAMGTKRYSDMGYYTPKHFYTQGEGMQASGTHIEHEWLARLIWHTTMFGTTIAAKMLEKLKVAKEQRNRLIPPTKTVRGIVTGTCHSWKYFLRLRNTRHADTAMRRLAEEVADAIHDAQWCVANEHMPLAPPTTVEDRHLIAAARIARVSYARSAGKDDHSLATTLLEQGHLSPFEHIAYWKEAPYLCCLNSKPQERSQDTRAIYGWEHWRAAQEKRNDPYGYNVWKR